MCIRDSFISVSHMIPYHHKYLCTMAIMKVMHMLIAVTSPIAGLTILTVFASQTTLVNHIRTTIVSCYNLKYQTSYILYMYVMTPEVNSFSDGSLAVHHCSLHLSTRHYHSF